MKSVAVHNGKFHADDVFSIAILKKIYPSLEVIRTRDPEKLSQVDARVDVGMKYDPKTLDFDHHQGEGAGERENGIPFASVGLVWKQFGEQLVQSKEAWEIIDKSLIQGLDADDCGVSTYKEITDASVFTIPKLISRLNPNWKENSHYDDQFSKAVDLATLILERELITANNFLAANKVVQEAIDSRTDERFIILDNYCPWKKLVKQHDEILYVIFPGSNQFCINAVSKKEFESKKPFPKTWRGKEKEELQKITGINGAAFCHKTGFFFATETKDEALNAVKQSLESTDEN